MRARRAITGLACLALATAAGCGSSHRTSTGARGSVDLAPAAPALLSSGHFLVAQVKGPTVKVYRDPTGSQPERSLRNPNRFGFPRVLLVRRAQGAWLEAYLPIRPNGATGWIRSASVSLRVNPYHLRIDLTRHRLWVWRGGTIIDKQPIGVGRAVTPTPAGIYYITDLFRLTNPNGPYGPYGFGISAYSNVLHAFAGGNGQVGIHGTDQPQGVGQNVSHGCIRLTNAAITRLAQILPLGTPLRIVR